MKSRATSSLVVFDMLNISVCKVDLFFCQVLLRRVPACMSARTVTANLDSRCSNRQSRQDVNTYSHLELNQITYSRRTCPEKQSFIIENHGTKKLVDSRMLASWAYSSTECHLACESPYLGMAMAWRPLSIVIRNSMRSTDL